jgi:hypothetical protein
VSYLSFQARDEMPAGGRRGQAGTGLGHAGPSPRVDRTRRCGQVLGSIHVANGALSRFVSSSTRTGTNPRCRSGAWVSGSIGTACTRSARSRSEPGPGRDQQAHALRPLEGRSPGGLPGPPGASDARVRGPPADEILGFFENLGRRFGSAEFRECLLLNAVSELGSLPPPRSRARARSADGTGSTSGL